MKYLTVLILTVLITLGSLPAHVLAQDANPKSSETVEAQNIAVARRVIEELWNGENIDVVDEVYADPFLAHSPANDQTNYFAPSFWRELIGIDFRYGFPDMHVTIEFISATKDYAVVHYTAQGTFTRPLSRTQPPTGQVENWDGVFVFRIENGRIVEEWWYWVNSIM